MTNNARAASFATEVTRLILNYTIEAIESGLQQSKALLNFGNISKTASFTTEVTRLILNLTIQLVCFVEQSKVRLVITSLRWARERSTIR